MYGNTDETPAADNGQLPANKQHAARAMQTGYGKRLIDGSGSAATLTTARVLGKARLW